MAKSDRFFFENFVSAAECCCIAANYLEECLTCFDPANIREMLVKMHGYEHAADIKRHEMSAALAKAFVTPIDREDLALLSHDIDEVADCIEEVMQRIYVNRIQTIMPEAITFAGHIVKSCDLMKELLTELANFKKPQKLRDLIVEIGHLEEECDKLYLEATVRVPEFTDDVLGIMFWREIFDHLEACADACEHVGDCVETVVMKNT